jgi:hypothetical protein
VSGLGTEAATVAVWFGMFRARQELDGELWFGYGETAESALRNLRLNIEFSYGKAV